MNEFETMMEQLEEITAKLESGELSLSESMEMFEKGVSLTKACSKLLSDAEQKIVKLTKTPEGEITEVPFDVDEN